MEFFVARKLKFKAWNTETKLLMRLNSIDCVKGELTKKEHVLLQFTGIHDVNGEEVYDMDVLLKDSERYIVHWQDEANRWTVSLLSQKHMLHHAVRDFVKTTTRLCNYFELQR
jgi:hypothetical protein